MRENNIDPAHSVYIGMFIIAPIKYYQTNHMSDISKA